MKRPILIVRTVSIEKLASVLQLCALRWPGHPLWVVTSPSRAGEVSRFELVARVVSYDGGSGGFSDPIAVDEPVACVVVPVANEGGSGYGNVLRACRRTKTERFALSPRCLRLKPLSRFRFALKWRLELGFSRFARFFAGYWAKRLLERERES